MKSTCRERGEGMTRERLRLYPHIIEELRMLEQQAGQPNIVRDSVIGSSPDYPYTAHVIPISGIDEHSAKGNADRKAQLERERDDIKRFVDGLPDGITQSAVRWYYLYGLQSWAKVAARMPGNTQASLEKRVSRLFEKPKTCQQCQV